jgi:ATP-dependent RNA/DNA helicase IGHMBP2
MKAAIEELGELAQILRLEREEEERRLESILKEQPIKQRKADGLCWHPVQVVKTRFGMSGSPELVIERAAGDHPQHQFQQGSPVFLYRTEGDEERVKAMVAWVGNNEMRLILATDDLPDDAQSGRWTVEIRFDDKTFFEMERALNGAINLEASHRRDVRDILLGYLERSAPLEIETPHIDAQLNTAQQAAVLDILTTADVAWVHGPPGTGKTTTLAEAIRLAVARGDKALVCAPTNAAVDHLTLKLTQLGIDVVRMGHATRMGEHTYGHSLEARLEAQPEMKLVRELRRRSDELRGAADKHKRNFGPEEREERRHAKQEAKNLLREAKETEKYILQRLLDQAQAVTCTLVGASDHRLAKMKWDFAFIDEAAQALEPAAWIPALMADRVVLAGDPFQLAPIVKSVAAAKKGLATTLLEKGIARTSYAVLLNEQYRMNERIMGFSNHWFYDDQLIAHPSVRYSALHVDEPVLEFIDTAGCGYAEHHPAEGSKESLANAEEAALLVRHLTQLLDRRGHQILSVGVIAPYRAQVETLRQYLPEDARIVAQTVDGFQGQERDVIYISLTRSNEDGLIGFLAEHRRMNVAMTRARRKLVVVGDSATLGGDGFYAAFVEYCEQHGAYHSAWEYMD